MEKQPWADRHGNQSAQKKGLYSEEQLLHLEVTHVKVTRAQN